MLNENIKFRIYNEKVIYIKKYKFHNLHIFT